MPVSQVLNPKGLIKKPTNNDLPYSASQPVISSYYATSTAAQTVINLSFSVDTSISDIFWLFIDGKKYDLGSSNDYTFTSVAADGTSAQVTLNQSLPAGLNIQAFKLGLKKESEFLTDSRFTALYLNQDAGFQNFVDTSSFALTATVTTGTPAAGTFYSSITGRANIVDLTQDLRPRFGVERIMVNSIYPLQNEFGPNGESVWGALNDTFGKIRLVGNPSPNIGSYGTDALRLVTQPTDGYIEVTFYGTGLNVLTLADGGARTFQSAVDGAALSTYQSATINGVIGNHGYAPNLILTAASGLSLGIHTVKLQNSSGSLEVTGFEVLNQFATGSNLVTVNPGIMYPPGKKALLSAQSTLAYNAAVTGTTGGRVIEYIGSDGSRGQAFTACAASPSYGTSASHTNEEAVRSFYWREFGSNQATDFSTLSTSLTARSFTLEDGTTTLVGTSVSSAVVGTDAREVLNQASGATVYFTFVGTGLDVMFPNSSLVATLAANVDNAGNQTIFTNPTGTQYVFKIASGLPYGTHTCAITYSSFTSGTGGISKFIVYQPKTPAIPSGAMQVGSYNVMANFAVATPSANNLYISTGVLRKMVAAREAIYTAAWGNYVINSTQASGLGTDTTTSGAAVAYTFFGTGAIIHTGFSNVAYNFTVSMDGSSNLTGTGTFAQSGSGLSFVAATGTVTGTASSGDYAEVRVSGLTLGFHTIKVTSNNTSTFFSDAIDVITPVHSYKSNLYADLQNTLPVGSNSVSDDRVFTPIMDSLPAAKSWNQAFGVTSSPTTASTTAVPMPEMSCSVKTSGGALKVDFTAQVFSSAAGAQIIYSIYVDGQNIVPGGGFTLNSAVATDDETLALSIITNVAPGFHKVDVMWWTNTGTLTANGIQRVLTVEEK